MDIQFIRTYDFAQVLCIIRDHNGLNRYLITPAMGNSNGTFNYVSVNGRLYFIDIVGATFANAFENMGTYEGMENIKPHMIAAVVSTHSNRFKGA